MTTFETYFITGFSVGFEFAVDEDEGVKAFLIDLGIVRFLWITELEA